MPNGNSTYVSIDNGKEGEVVNELPKATASGKDADDGSEMRVESSVTQEKTSSTTAIYSATTNAQSASKHSFDISATLSAGSGRRVASYSSLKLFTFNGRSYTLLS